MAEQTISTIIETPNPQGGAPVETTVQADPQHEYVAGGNLYAVRQYLATLPPFIDDLERDLGDDIYTRMLHDPEVAKDVNLLKMATLAQGITVAPAVPDTDTTNYKRAKEIADFCQRTFDNLETPLVEVLYEMLNALVYGHSVAEQTYRLGDGMDAGKLVLDSIKVKPRYATAFVIDTFMNVVGIAGAVPRRSDDQSELTGGQTLPGIGSAMTVLPREKFVVLTHRPEHADPRGQSILRAAYTPWWHKLQTWGEWLKYIIQFAGPSLIGYAPPNAQPMPKRNPDGSTILDTNGNPVVEYAQDTMLTSLLSFKNGTVVVMPGEAKVEPVEMQGEGKAFLDALVKDDEQISKAVLNQTLATNDAQHDTRAASQTHQDVLSLVIQFIKLLVANTVRSDIVRPLVRYNYGDAALDLLPKVSCGAQNEHDITSMLEALAKVGYTLHDSQFAELDQLAGMPPRDIQQIEAERKQKEQLQAQLQSQPPQPNQQQPANGNQKQPGKVGA